MRCAPWSSGPAAPPRSSAAHFPVPRSSPRRATASCAEVAARPALVVATPGAEPRVPGGYGAALLLDTWALLGRQDLRAAEDALWRWMSAAALVRARGDGGVVTGGRRIINSHSAIADPLGSGGSRRGRTGGSNRSRPAAERAHGGHGRRRRGGGGAARRGPAAGRSRLLGPVDLPAGVRRPAGTPAGVPVTRMLVRVRREQGLALAAALRRGVSVLSPPAKPTSRSGCRSTRCTSDSSAVA